MHYHTFIHTNPETEDDVNKIIQLNRMFSALILDLLLKINAYEGKKVDESIIFKLNDDIDNYMMEIQFVEFGDTHNLGIKIRAVKNDYDKKRLN